MTVDPILVLLGLTFAAAIVFTGLAIFMFFRKQIMKRWQQYKFNKNRLGALPKQGARVVRLGEDELQRTSDYQDWKRTPRHIRIPRKHQ